MHAKSPLKWLKRNCFLPRHVRKDIYDNMTKEERAKHTHLALRHGAFAGLVVAPVFLMLFMDWFRSRTGHFSVLRSWFGCRWKRGALCEAFASSSGSFC
jgi:hypothetical protein